MCRSNIAIELVSTVLKKNKEKKQLSIETGIYPY